MRLKSLISVPELFHLNVMHVPDALYCIIFVSLMKLVLVISSCKLIKHCRGFDLAFYQASPTKSSIIQHGIRFLCFN